MVEKATNGRLILEPILDLVPEEELLFATMDGRADMSFSPIQEISGTYPQWAYGSIPFYWSGTLEYYKAMTDPRMIDILTVSYANAGLIFLGESGGAALNTIWAKKPIRTIEDMAGLKTRSTGFLPTIALEAMGAAPLFISEDMVEAARRGTVDAALTSIPWGFYTGLYDVCKYISVWNLHPAMSCVLTANPDSFNALPEDLQEILIDVTRTLVDQSAFAIYIQYEITAPAIARSVVDYTIPEASEIQRAVVLSKPALDKWIEISGPEGAAILEICKDYASGAK